MGSARSPCGDAAVLVSRWFSRHYSLGSYHLVGWHFGGLVLAPVTGQVIAHFGWRAACLTIVAGLITVGLIPALFTLRVRTPSNSDWRSMAILSMLLPGRRRSMCATTRPAHSARCWVGDILVHRAHDTGVLHHYSGLITHQSAIVEGAGFIGQLPSTVLGATAGFAGSAVSAPAGCWIAIPRAMWASACACCC